MFALVSNDTLSSQVLMHNKRLEYLDVFVEYLRTASEPATKYRWFFDKRDDTILCSVIALTGAQELIRSHLLNRSQRVFAVECYLADSYLPNHEIRSGYFDVDEKFL